MSATLYETDLYAWTQRQAALLREEEFTEVDWNNLIEEIDSLGAEQLHKVEGHLIRLVQHLLKWQYQPARRSRSWRLTIVEQRSSLQRVLRKNPTLRVQLPEILMEIYPDAVKLSIIETGLDKRTFPAECPWTAIQIMDEEFWSAG